ncbi:hypothetical protein BHE74_00049817, partial [Ensete ventricosum]
MKRHLLFPEPEDLNQLRDIAARFEEKIFTEADNQVHFIRLISNSVVLSKRRRPRGVFSPRGEMKCLPTREKVRGD